MMAGIIVRDAFHRLRLEPTPQWSRNGASNGNAVCQLFGNPSKSRRSALSVADGSADYSDRAVFHPRPLDDGGRDD